MHPSRLILALACILNCCSSLPALAQNSSPDIGWIHDQTIPEDTKQNFILEVRDETPTENLAINAFSSNPSVVTAGIIRIGGTVIVTLDTIPDQSGSATITIAVTDADGATSRRSFLITVVPVNDQPTITSIPDQTTTVGMSIGPIPFTVSDIETAAESLVVSAASSDQNLVPDGNMTLGGGGANRTITVTPAALQTGTATITVTVKDSDEGTSDQSFTVTVTPSNQSPAIVISPQVRIYLDEQPIIPFLISDAESPSSKLTVTVDSSNPSLIAPASIAITGFAATRNLQFTEPPLQLGNSILTVSVADEQGKQASAQCAITVENAPPDILGIPPHQAIPANAKSTKTIHFTVSDLETPAELLIVTAISSNPALVPDHLIELGGTGSDRTIKVWRPREQIGSAEITVTVSDGASAASDSFNVTAGINAAPEIFSIPDQVTEVNTPTSEISFTIDDAETPVPHLVVSFDSSNSTLVSDANMVWLPGNGRDRAFQLWPSPNQTGDSRITVTVTDAGGLTKSTSFSVHVGPKTANSDFNNDGVPDIVFQDDQGFAQVWFMSGDGDVLSSSFITPGSTGDQWHIIDAADLDGDNRPDFLLQHNDGSLAVWYMEGVRVISTTPLNPSHPGDPGWKAVATGDFNKDGEVDVLFQHTDGSLAVWHMRGANLISSTPFNPSGPADPSSRVVGTGDFNRDGDIDVLFQNDTGILSIWYMGGVGGTSLFLNSLTVPESSRDRDWRVIGTTDLNADGHTDLLFQNRKTSNLGLWYMYQPALVLGKTINLNPGKWSIVAP